MAAVVFKLSKAAIQLVKTGEAVLSSGGIREKATGKLIELAKPVVSKAVSSASAFSLGPIGGAVSIASSLGANVQCAFIQKSVNEANVKLDHVIERLNSLSESMGSLSAIHTLSWVNAAFGLANAGISVAGFYMTLNRLNMLQNQIDSFAERYKADRNDDILEKYENAISNLKGTLHFLSDYSTGEYTSEHFIQREQDTEQYISQAIALLKSIIRQFLRRAIDGRIACEMIFTLMQCIAQTINAYCCYFYFIHHKENGSFLEWKSSLKEVETEQLKEAVERYLLYSPELISISPIRKKDAVCLLFESVSQQQNRLEACARLLPTLTKEQYTELDNLLNEKVYEAAITQLPQFSGITIQEADKRLTDGMHKVDLSQNQEDYVICLS